MPRIHIRCNVITDPDKAGRRRLHCTDIYPYLPAFYHVPVKVVYEVLGMSHHTLAPLRRQWNLKRWPFADICRGAFTMGGKTVLWDDVEDLRKKMMSADGVDERIVKILETMGERAASYKDKVNVEVARMVQEKRVEDGESAPIGCVQLPPAPSIASACQAVEMPNPAEGDGAVQSVETDDVDRFAAALGEDAGWLEDFSRDLQGWLEMAHEGD